MARPPGVATQAVLPLMDGQVALEECLKMLLIRDVEGGIRCAKVALALNRLALGKIEGLDGCTSKPSGSNGGTFHD